MWYQPFGSISCLCSKPEQKPMVCSPALLAKRAFVTVLLATWSPTCAIYVASMIASMSNSTQDGKTCMLLRYDAINTRGSNTQISTISIKCSREESEAIGLMRYSLYRWTYVIADQENAPKFHWRVTKVFPGARHFGYAPLTPRRFLQRDDVQALLEHGGCQESIKS